MAALTAHQSPFLLLTPTLHHARIMYLLLPLQDSATTFCLQTVSFLTRTHKSCSAYSVTPWRSSPPHTHAHTHIRDTVLSHSHCLLRLLRLQFIEASLHGHNFWNSNCYLIWLRALSPLRLRWALIQMHKNRYGIHGHNLRVKLKKFCKVCRAILLF